METLLAEYGIDFEEFREHIMNCNAIVAGSSALWGYLKQRAIEPGFEPGDIDIWISIREPIAPYQVSYKLGKNFEKLRAFLARQGYDRSEMIDTSDVYYESMGAIDEVISFVNKAGKKIQMIQITMGNIMDYIRNNFDLSICATWWKPRTNTFDTLNAEMTLKREFYFLQSQMAEGNLTTKEKARFEKYLGRGFKFTDSPCTYWVAPDSREGLDDGKLAGVEAFDIFTFDDVPVRDFLKESAWHMILKAGEKYFAFHRKNLFNSMNSKMSAIPNIGNVYETPFNQCVTHDALNKLMYSDYSIFELVFEYSTKFGYNASKEKSLFTMRCFTVQQWINGEPGLVISPPALPVTSPAVTPSQDDAMMTALNEQIASLAQFVNERLLQEIEEHALTVDNTLTQEDQ